IMRDRIGKIAKAMKTMAAQVWRHRVSYAGLALAYGAGCVGVIDKEVVAQIAAAIYAAMVAQKH
ncbi:MAG: hypothetical protein AAGP08_17765, partial [Pseudomonadota bacterium]